MFGTPIHAGPAYPGRREAFSPEMLHVVTMISNPIRYRSRYNLYREFKQRVLAAGATLWTAEISFGERPHSITDCEDPQVLQLRTGYELWHKENALNLLIARLPRNWKYVAWIDADTMFTRPDWAVEAIHLLQHYAVIQMFSETADMGPDYTILPDTSKTPGMIRQHAAGYEWGGKTPHKFPYGGYPYGRHYGHCGFAWSARRDALEALGGLIDFSVCGANDHHMARGLLGDIGRSTNANTTCEFQKALAIWEARAKALRLNVGFMPGLLLHYWHGPKKNRQYQSRWNMLVEHRFNPYTDLKRDWQGLYQLHDDGTERMRKLRDDLRAYFRQRNEDASEA